MTFLKKLGFGKMEEPPRRSFDEIVHSSISPQSVRANELVEICERARQRCKRWDALNGGFSYGPNFQDDASMALAYLGVGRPHDAEAVLRGMEYRFDGFLTDGYVCQLRDYSPVLAAYGAVKGNSASMAFMERLLSRISSKDSVYRRAQEELEWPTFALGRLAAGDRRKAEELVQKALRGKGSLTPRCALSRGPMLFMNKQPDTHNIRFNAYDNAMLAITLYCLGGKKEAERIVRGIESMETDPKNGLVLNCGANNRKTIYQMDDIAPTALLSFAHSLLDKSEASKEMKHGPFSGPYR